MLGKIAVYKINSRTQLHFCIVVVVEQLILKRHLIKKYKKDTLYNKEKISKKKFDKILFKTYNKTKIINSLNLYCY